VAKCSPAAQEKLQRSYPDDDLHAEAYSVSMNFESRFRIVPLPAALVTRVRRTLVDDFGHRLKVTTNASRVPCRFTLEMTEPGEELILLGYSPFTRDHPYRETGPIFIRLLGDTGYTDIHHFPPQLDSTKRVFRCYDAEEQIVDARLGTTDPESLIVELFANPHVECIHVRALTYGCFTFKIERA